METEASERIARLEQEVAGLREEVVRLREQMGQPTLAPMPASPPPAPAPRRPHGSTVEASLPQAPIVPKLEGLRRAAVPARRSIEELVGRYGTIAVATITLLVGVGAFLGWAIKHGLLGPTTRVVLGYLAAAALAGVGARLRRGDTRQFGNILLALALCVVHLVCWSAGPLLHVMPSGAALAIATVASAVLAGFALRQEEQVLCALGFGGALIAPFVTSDRSGNAIALAVYGVIVIALSAAALGDRAWRAALGVTACSVLVYVVAVSEVRPAHTAWPWILERVGLLFTLVLLAAIIPVARGENRRVLVRVAAFALIIGALLSWAVADLWSLGLTIAGAVLAIGTLHRLRPRTVEEEAAGVAGWRDKARHSAAVHRAILDALALPIGLLIAAIAVVETPLSTTTALVATGWAMLAGTLSYRTRGGPETEYFATTSALAALLVPYAAFSHHERLVVVGVTAVGLALGFVATRAPRLAFGTGALAAAAIASVSIVVLLSERQVFQYLPFLTPPSAVALAVVAGWLVLWRLAGGSRPFSIFGVAGGARVKRVPVVGAAITAFLWFRAELDGAWSVTASTALLIVYYATTGTFAIWLGRRRGPKELRIVGLVLTLWAAGKALVQATVVPSVAVRIGLYFAVSAFLIAVAYWYRKGGDASQTSAKAEPAS